MVRVFCIAKGHGTSYPNPVPNLLLLADAADKTAGLFFGFGAFALILAIAGGIFWLWMLVDALTNSALDSTMRIVWAAIIFFLPFLGALAYLFVGRRPGPRSPLA